MAAVAEDSANAGAAEGADASVAPAAGESKAPASRVPSGSAWPSDASQYTYSEKIGQGAFATVYHGKCLANGEDVAIKVINLDKVTSGIEDIRDEVLTMKTCIHPNVLTCYAAFTSGNDLWLVMPYMDRGSAHHLMRLLKNEGVRAEGLPQMWVRTIIGEALKGIKYLHDQKLIHRDIKAGNILVNSKGEVKIADFGVSAWVQESGSDEQHQTFVGTPCWMAPEVMEQADDHSYPADVWSIGITALELAKGYAPYAKLAPMKVLLMTLQEPPPTLQSYPDEKRGQKKVSGTEWASKSTNFKKFVGLCLKKEAKDRATVAQLLTKNFPAATSAAFAAELCEKCPKALHQEKDVKSAPQAVTGTVPTSTNDFTERDIVASASANWDLSDMGGGGDASQQTEVTDENFGAMFASANLKKAES